MMASSAASISGQGTVDDTRKMEARQKADEMQKLHGSEAEAKLIAFISAAVRAEDHDAATRLDAALRVLEARKPKRRRF